MERSKNKFQQLFDKQKQHQFVVGNSTAKQRIQKLSALKKAVEVTFRTQLQDALYVDFKKPRTETDLTEIYPVIGEIKHVKKYLKSWMRRQDVPTPMALIGTSSWITYEPKGVCLIISPWNFPINLTLGPLITAIAAGNTVIIKPSEFTPNTSKVMASIIEHLFIEEEVALVQGEVSEAKALLALPFNHIFFTGSPAVGKLIMKAAAENLTSVTLELGGKSPTIVDKTAAINSAAKKIAWGKFINNGQVCLSPDYLLIHESVKEVFIAALKTEINSFYSENVIQSEDYCRIVNERQHQRLIEHIEDAKQGGATLELGGNFSKDTNYIEPTILSNLSENSTILQEEIFGPILPVITYKNINEVINYVNANEKPLAIYIYSKNKRFIHNIMSNTRAGTTCINNNIIQYSNHHLPFGGSNHSGIGKSHGFYGFQEFSNQRAVLKQHVKSAIEYLYPPYTYFKQKLVDLTIKWF